MILITRSYHSATKTIKKLNLLGYQGICSPLTYIIGCIDHKIAEYLPQYDKIIISSQNGANAFISNLNKISKKPFLVVGEQAKNILIQNRCCNIEVVFPNMKSLLKYIKDDEIRKYIYFCGYNIAIDNLPKKIAKIVLYSAVSLKITAEINKLLRDGSIKYIFLYSRRSAKIFFDSIDLSYAIIVIVISPAVKNFIKSNYNTDFIIIAAKYPNEDSMLRCLYEEKSC